MSDDKKITSKACTMCGKTKKLSDYYVSNSIIHAGDKRVQICKKCIREYCVDDGVLNVDNFRYILQQIDKPFIVNAMDGAIDESKESIEKGRGRTELIGLYMKNVQLGANKHLRWQDSDEYNKSDHSELHNDIKTEDRKPEVVTVNEYDDDLLDDSDETLYYSSAWRGKYTKSDLTYLENYMNNLHQDYAIVTAHHKDYAYKIAKSSLHMDQCFNDMMNGIPGADKKYKDARSAFTAMSKEAKFSESSRNSNEAGLSSFSVISSMVEAHNWIYEHIPVENDQIDNLITHLSTITKSV